MKWYSNNFNTILGKFLNTLENILKYFIGLLVVRLFTLIGKVSGCKFWVLASKQIANFTNQLVKMFVNEKNLNKD